MAGQRGLALSEHIAREEIVMFAFWLRCHEGKKALRRETSHAASLTTKELASINELETGIRGYRGALCARPDCPLFHDQRPSGIALANVSFAAGHTPELVEWASELLAHNWSYVL